MPEELLDEQARQRLEAIFAGPPEQRPTEPVTAPEPEVEKEPLLCDLIENCFTQQTPLRRVAGRGVEAFISHNERTTNHGGPEQRFPIPDEDLKILEGIYHNKLPDCGRKRGAINRYIAFFKKDMPEPTDHFSQLKRQLERS
jgi:hypothetical protein